MPESRAEALTSRPTAFFSLSPRKCGTKTPVTSPVVVPPAHALVDISMSRSLERPLRSGAEVEGTCRTMRELIRMAIVGTAGEPRVKISEESDLAVSCQHCERVARWFILRNR